VSRRLDYPCLSKCYIYLATQMRVVLRSEALVEVLPKQNFTIALAFYPHFVWDLTAKCKRGRNVLFR
jgi:hypothetical protein